MRPDAELLRQYAGTRDEAAFAELVQRHVNLVYRAALRQLGGDSHRAQEAAQLVFTLLARKAGSLARHPSVAGWLYTTTHFTVRSLRRDERRRQAREQEAFIMHELEQGARSDAEWERLRPVLDDAMQQLGERDRIALLARFFEARSFGEIGAHLALSEDAARMRVERALEKLRALLARRGVTSTSAALGLLLAHEAAAAIPASVATSMAGSALASASAAATASSSTLAGLLQFMSTTKMAAGGAALVAALAIGTAVHEIAAKHEAEAALAVARQEQAALRAQLGGLSQRTSGANAAVPRPVPAELRDGGDFQALVAQLRAAGYAEEVVRNVVADVVGHHFKARRRTLGLEQAPLPSEFWKSPVTNGSAGKPEEIAGRRALEQQQREVLRGLFGADYDVSEDTRQRRAHGLPEATAAKLHQIFADYRDMEEQARTDVKTPAEIRAKLELLAKEKRADIERLLTPEQLLEFDLRTGAGTALHNRLGSFEVTETEFRALYAAQKAFNDAHPGLATRDRNAQFELEISRVLGETRYAELLGANQKGAQQTGAFVELRAFVIAHNLPPSVAATVLRVQGQYQPQLNLIAQNPSLTAEQKTANCATLGAAARKELLQALGPTAFEAYEKTRGGWLPAPGGNPAPAAPRP